MKIELAKENLISFNTDVINTEFSQENMYKIKTLLSGLLYSDSYSFLAEMVQNATDNHIEFGITKNVEIGFDYDEEGNYIFIRDFGSGISPALMRSVLSQFGKSTKDQSDKFKGGMGIGRFSLLRYSKDDKTRKSYYVTNVDGIKYTYLLMDDQGAKFLPIDQTHTTDSNGTTIKVYYTGYNEKALLKNALHTKVVYFEGVSYNGFTGSLYKHDTFLYTSDYKGPNKLHISYNGYFYNIPWDQLKLNEIAICVALPFAIGELEVTPNREELIINKSTLILIKNKIDLFMNYAKSKAVFEFEDFNEYNDAIKSGKFNLIGDLNITYHSLDIKKLVFLPLLPLNLIYIVPKMDNGILNKTKVKVYYSDKYKKDQLFIKNNSCLSEKYFRMYMQDKRIISPIKYKLDDYIEFLNLGDFPKSQWRALIELYNNWFKKQFGLITFSEIKKSEDFINFVKEEKKSSRDNITYSSSPKRTNIQHVARWSENNKRTVVFDTNIKLGKSFITVTRNTPQSEIEFLFNILKTNVQMVIGKEENFEWIKKNEIIAQVYWSQRISDVLDDYCDFFKVCKYLDLNSNRDKLKSYVIDNSLHYSTVKVEFMQSLKDLIDLHGIRTEAENEFNKFELFLKEFKYLYHVSRLDNSERNLDSIVFIHKTIQDLKNDSTIC